MIETPYEFESKFSKEDLAKIGQLSLRWSHTEHIIGNCLRDMLKLDPKVATKKVYRLFLTDRLKELKKLAEKKKVSGSVKMLLDELQTIMPAIAHVRNAIAHATVLIEKDAPVFHRRREEYSLTLGEVLASEELTNYASHLAFTLRIVLREKADPRGTSYKLPERPEIPEFLRDLISTVPLAR